MSELEDELAVRRLTARYCHVVDEQRMDDLLALFAEDATVTIMGQTYVGHAGVREWNPGAFSGKHVTANLLVTFEGDDATGRADWLFFLPGEGGQVALAAAGVYHDRYRRTGDGWQFVRREIELLGQPAV